MESFWSTSTAPDSRINWSTEATYRSSHPADETLKLYDAGSNAKPVLEVGMGELKIYDESGEVKDLAKP